MTTRAIGTPEKRPATAASGAADWVCLAAAPTFAVMALLTGVLGGGQQEYVLRCASCVTARRNGLDVHADERLPFGALAEADLQPANRCSPVLTLTKSNANSA